MRILILGGDGTIGHYLLKAFCEHDVRATLRKSIVFYADSPHFNKNNCFFDVDVFNSNALLKVIVDFKPQVIINALGIIKYRDQIEDVASAIEINALFPHRLSMIGKLVGARLIQLSTDCVFSGNKGNYTEDDNPDAYDVYGKTKALGELAAEPHCVTLRTSFIGPELYYKTGLVEWFLKQTGEVKGYRKAIYTGLVVAETAKVIKKIIEEFPQMSGLWHLASTPIDKFTLLVRLAEKLGRHDIKMIPEDTVQIDRSLCGTKLNTYINYHPPSWDDMLENLVEKIRQA